MSLQPRQTWPTILISGAGISGLALGQALLQARISFRIFERDPAHSFRAQGYRVRINGTGIAALKQCLPAELYSRLQDSCAHVVLPPEDSNPQGPFAILNALTGKNNRDRFPRAPPTRDARDTLVPLNGDRSVLRSVLMTGLEGHIEYGRELVSYEIDAPSVEGEKPDGKGVTIRFRDGSQERGALLVGADGSRSRVRQQLVPEHVLFDTEGRWIYGKTPLTPEFLESFSPEALKGFTAVQDLESELPRSLLVEAIRFKDNEFRSQLPQDYVYWVLMSHKDSLTQLMDDSVLLNLSPQEAATLSQKLTAHWDPAFHPLFALQEPAQASLLRIASANPKIPYWEPSGAVTLIGDAAHVMSPTAGVGATSALRDAALLTQLLCDEGINAQSVGKYESSMREFAGEAITRSFFAGKVMFGLRPFEELKKVPV